jgi:hypothetical protein
MSGGQLAHLHPLLGEALVLISLLILMAGMAQNLVYVVQLYFGYRELRERQPRHGDDRLWWLLTSHVTVPISLIVPAHNEEESIVDTVHSVLSLHYPQFEVVVVNDGSTDGTLAPWRPWSRPSTWGRCCATTTARSSTGRSADSTARAGIRSSW